MSNLRAKNNKTFGKVGVFVMGDMSRSPRMLNHAIELAQNQENAVELIGQLENDLPITVASEPIRVRTITSSYIKKLKRLPSFAYLLIRLMIETLLLFYHFFIQIRPRYDYLLVQNPPGIPVIIVLFFYRLIFRAKVWVDVHNFGFTLYQTKNRLLLAVLKFVEIKAIRFTADRVFVVSDNMRKHLAREWGIRNATVLYDMPNQRQFKAMSLKEKHNFLVKFPEFQTGKDESIIARADSRGNVTEKEVRPLLFVVSSSWSHDDYFDLLIDALKQYEADETNKTPLVFVMTGSGPAKAHYSQIFKTLGLEKISFVILWFKASDYPKIIGSVDYGVSLHNSTSGFDLPIKALDYMACNVPCIAYNYTDTIKELVIEGKNGMLFNTAEELTSIFKKVTQEHGRLKWEFPKGDWTTEWREKVC